MSTQQTITSKLTDRFNPEHLEVVNESSNHNVPEGSESHFKVLIVSKEFDGLPRIQRQRLVNEVLKDELAGKIHALAQRALTVEEWKNSSEFKSPDCAHKN